MKPNLCCHDKLVPIFFVRGLSWPFEVNFIAKNWITCKQKKNKKINKNKLTLPLQTRNEFRGGSSEWFTICGDGNHC
jgi:hypothetical protein